MIHTNVINSIVAKCENVLIQSPSIGITWICQSIQWCYKVPMNRLNQVKRMTQMIHSNQSTHYICWTFLENLFRWSFFGKRWISLTFLGHFESILLIQSYQSFKVNRFSHLLYENKLTQSRSSSLGKGTESIQSILQKKIDSNQSLSRVDCYKSLVMGHWNNCFRPKLLSGKLGAHWNWVRWVDHAG